MQKSAVIIIVIIFADSYSTSRLTHRHYSPHIFAFVHCFAFGSSCLLSLPVVSCVQFARPAFDSHYHPPSSFHVLFSAIRVGSCSLLRCIRRPLAFPLFVICVLRLYAPRSQLSFRTHRHASSAQNGRSIGNAIVVQKSLRVPSNHDRPKDSVLSSSASISIAAERFAHRSPALRLPVLSGSSRLARSSCSRLHVFRPQSLAERDSVRQADARPFSHQHRAVQLSSTSGSGRSIVVFRLDRRIFHRFQYWPYFAHSVERVVAAIADSLSQPGHVSYVRQHDDRHTDYASSDHRCAYNDRFPHHTILVHSIAATVSVVIGRPDVHAESADHVKQHLIHFRLGAFPISTRFAIQSNYESFTVQHFGSSAIDHTCQASIRSITMSDTGRRPEFFEQVSFSASSNLPARPQIDCSKATVSHVSH